MAISSDQDQFTSRLQIAHDRDRDMICLPPPNDLIHALCFPLSHPRPFSRVLSCPPSDPPTSRRRSVAPPSATAFRAQCPRARDSRHNGAPRAGPGQWRNGWHPPGSDCGMQTGCLKCDLGSENGWIKSGSKHDQAKNGSRPCSKPEWNEARKDNPVRINQIKMVTDLWAHDFPFPPLRNP